MNMALNHRARGVHGVRADSGNAPAVFAEMKKTIEDFKAAHEEELKGINAKFADVVTTEKVEKINAEISKLQKTLDDINAFQAAMKLNGGSGDGPTPEQREHGQVFDKWFRRGADAGLSELEVKAGLTTQSDPDGGFLVPVETERTIDRVLGVASVIRQIATVMPIGTDTYRKFINMGGAGAGWVGEEENRPETSTPSLRELVFSVMEMYADPATTQKMLDDGIIDIAAWLADEVQTTFAELEGAAFVSGDGVKKPRGILSYDKVANSDYEWGKLGYSVSGAASAFAAGTGGYDALLNLHYSLKAGYRNNASWVMSDPTMLAIRKFKDADGNFIWRAPDAAAEMATILGKPVYTDDNMPKIEAGAFPIIFGDIRRGYMVLDRQGIRVLRDPFTDKPRIHFYTTKRVGGGIANFEALKLLKVGTS